VGTRSLRGVTLHDRAVSGGLYGTVQFELGAVEIVKVRFYRDVESGEPHMAQHGVSEQEAREVLARPLEDRPGREGSRVALGQTAAGRYLRVIYVPDPEPDSVFVITAYDLGPKAKRALRRRRRRKPR
jgi:hypothetical protein